MTRRKRTVTLIVTALAILIVFTAAESRAAGLGFGLRAGFGLDPDQGVVGVQMTFPKLVKPLVFAPSFDIGFGDNVTTYSLNADFRFLNIKLSGSATGIYLAAGPTFTNWKPEHGDSDTEVGISLVAGFGLPLKGSSRYNLEGRLGLSDVPDVRVLLGFTF
jgi:hypothetical protein